MLVKVLAAWLTAANDTGCQGQKIELPPPAPQDTLVPRGMVGLPKTLIEARQTLEIEIAAISKCR